MINFQAPWSRFGPESLQISTNPLIAVFWHDIDITQGGNIYYRLATDTLTLAEAHFFLVSLYSIDDPNSPNALDFYPSSVFVCTWDQVSAYGSVYEGNRSNTFQVILMTNEVNSYVLFIYKDIQWGLLSTIGFQAEDGLNSFELPYSGTLETIDMDSFSNVGRKGVFVYRVDGEYSALKFIRTTVYLILYK